jgi:protoheme ferro-lyase
LVADDVATLVDLDVVFRRRIADLGMKYRRVRALGDSPAFISAVADIVVQQAALEPSGAALAHATGEARSASQA